MRYSEHVYELAKMQIYKKSSLLIFAVQQQKAECSTESKEHFHEIPQWLLQKDVEMFVCPEEHSSVVTTVCAVAGDFHFEDAPTAQSPPSEQ